MKKFAVDEIKTRWRTLRDKYNKLFKKLSDHGNQYISDKEKKKCAGVEGLLLELCAFLDDGILRKFKKRYDVVKQEPIFGVTLRESPFSFTPTSTESMNQASIESYSSPMPMASIDTEFKTLHESIETKSPADLLNFVEYSQESTDSRNNDPQVDGAIFFSNTNLTTKNTTALTSDEIVISDSENENRENAEIVQKLMTCMSKPEGSQDEGLKELARNSIVQNLGNNVLGACHVAKKQKPSNYDAPTTQNGPTPEGIIVVDILMGFDSKNRAKNLKKVLAIGKDYNKSD